MRFVRILLALLTVVSLTVHAKDFIRTEAWGNTEAEARHNAFIKAIETKVGVLMLSDRETKNYEQVKNDIYAYSDGFVSNYTIVDVMPEGNGVRIIVDSKIITSKIKNRILIGNQKSADINGDVAVASYNTYKNTKAQSDSLLKKVLMNYPKNTYIVTFRESKVKTSTNRELELDIDFSVKLNPEFVSSLTKTLDVIENPNTKEYASKIVIDRTELIRMFSHQNTYYLDDNLTQEVLYKYLIPRDTRLNINLEGDNGVLYSTCRPVDTFVKLSGSKVTFFAGKTNYYAAQITDPKMFAIMQDVTKIQLSMVNVKECKND